MHRDTRIPLLIARIGEQVCALPIEHVVETMRPGAIEDGTLLHRGDRVPVIDPAALLGRSSAPRRCVVVRAGGGRASVLVDEVLGVQRVEREAVATLKALLATAQLSRLSRELGTVLGTVRVMDEAARG